MRFLFSALLATLFAPLVAHGSDLEPVPILSVVIGGGQLGSLDCQVSANPTVLPGPPIEVPTPCGPITVQIVENVLTMEPQGAVLYLEAIRFTAPQAAGPVVPIVVRSSGGFADGAVGEVGGRYPTALANKGGTLMVIPGDSIRIEAVALDAGSQSPATLTILAHIDSDGSAPVADADSDGEPDSTDACASTPSGATVDAAGCSVAQFCAAKVVDNFASFLTCAAADWQNDEPITWPADCQPASSGGRWSTFTCRAR